MQAKVHWRDLLVGAAGLWLMASPAVLGYALDNRAALNAYGVGALLIVFCVMWAWRLEDLGNEILNIVFGLWLVCAPYTLGFFDQRAAALNAIAVGLIVIALAISDLGANGAPDRPDRPAD